MSIEFMLSELKKIQEVCIYADAEDFKLHPDDVVGHTRRIEFLTEIIKDFEE